MFNIQYTWSTGGPKNGKPESVITLSTANLLTIIVMESAIIMKLVTWLAVDSVIILISSLVAL